MVVSTSAAGKAGVGGGRVNSAAAGWVAAMTSWQEGVRSMRRLARSWSHGHMPSVHGTPSIISGAQENWSVGLEAERAEQYWLTYWSIFSHTDVALAATVVSTVLVNRVAGSAVMIVHASAPWSM